VADAPPSTAEDRRTWPNQPEGFRELTQRAFDHKAKRDNDRGESGSEGWDGIEFRSRNFTIIEDPTAPRSPPSVGQYLYPAGFASGRSPGTAQIAFKRPVREMYISLWIKLSPNWHGNQSSTNKMFFLWIGGGNRVFVSAEGAGMSRLQPQLRLQGVADKRRRLRPNVGRDAAVARGEWQRWEFLVKANDPGAANGELHWWIDGRKISEYRDVNIVPAGRRPLWDQFQWSATYGGGGAPVPHDQWIRWDHIYISGR
jgi:hypothetical protein